MALIQSLIAVLIVSLIAVVVAIPFFLKKNISKKVLIILMSISVGTLLGTVFIHLLPEAYAHAGEHEDTHIEEIGNLVEEHAHDHLGHGLEIALIVIGGFLLFFLIEKLIHYHHNHKCMHDGEKESHSHAFAMGPLNLIGDGVHNFIDGLIIFGSFLVSIPLGIATTISVIFHELPQEIADFGILLYSGFSKKKALLYNFISAASAFLGVFVGLILSRSDAFLHFIVPFAAGNFLYIAAANLTPELHKQCTLKDSFFHVISILFGVGIMVAVFFFFGHSH